VLVVRHLRTPNRSPPTPKLNKPRPAVDSVNAARVTAVPPVRLALQVSMDAMVSMDSQANPEIVVHQPPIPAPATKPLKNNARAAHHPVMLAPQDPVDPTDPPAMPVPQVPMVKQAVLVQLARPAQPADPAKMAAPAPQENPAKPVKVDQAQQVLQVPTANPAVPARLVNPVDPAKMAAPAVQALPAMLVLQAVLAKLAVPVVPANPVKQVLQAVANTAHQLVWLQVIKFSGNAEYRQRSKKTSKSIDIFPQFISASYVFTSQF